MAKFGSYTQIDALADDDIGLVKDASSGGTRYFTMQQLGDYVDSDQGFVTGPASATDNAVVRFDTTTGKLVQNSSFIVDDSGNVTAGAWTATDVAVLHGGTGASTAEDARTNLGLAIGTNVQAYDAGLQSIADLTTVADRMIYTTASDTYAVATLTSFARTVLDDADALTARATLGVTIDTDVQAYSANLAAIAALAVTDGNIIVGNGSTWVAESGSTARTSLGAYGEGDSPTFAGLTVTGNITQDSTADSYHIVDRGTTSNNAGLLLRTAGTGDWIFRTADATGDLYLYSYGTATNVLKVARATGALTVVSDITIAAGSITSASGAISFGNENLTTTGTLSAGATTVTGVATVSGNVGIGTLSPAYVGPAGFENSTGDSRILSVIAQSGASDAALVLGRSDSTVIRATIWHDGNGGDLYVDNHFDNAGGEIYFRTRVAGTPVTTLALNSTGATVTGTLTLSSASSPRINGSTTLGYLDLYGDSAATSGIRLFDTGNVSIGASTDNARLFVFGTTNGANQRLTSTTDNNYVVLGAATNSGSDNNAQDKWSLRWRGRPTGSLHYFALYNELSASEAWRTDSSNNFLLGATATSNNAQFYATKTYSNASGSDIGGYFNYTQGIASTGSLSGGRFAVTTTHTTGTLASLKSSVFAAYSAGAGGTTTELTGVDIDVRNTNASAVVTTAYGLYIRAFTATGTITNRWGIYQAGASENNYFAGPVGLGTSTVAAAFANLAASTTARASLNIPSGTAPTSPTNGDIWSDGSDILVRLGGTTYTLQKA